MGNLNDDMRAEMEFHLEARAADLAQRHGLTKEQALRQARLEFGSAAAYREQGREAYGLRWLDELRADLRYAWRGLRKSPGFTLAATGILALAIGVNAAFFTLYGNYALKPLPIRAADRHYELEGRNAQAGRTFGWTSEELGHLRAAGQPHVEGIYSLSGPLQVLLVSPVERQSMVTVTSANYFALTGGRAAQGRTYTEAEEHQPVAVLSHSGWQRLFPGLPSPLGRQVRVRATWMTVIGVMPPAFTGTAPIVPDLWVGPGMGPALRDGVGHRASAYAILRPQTAPGRAAAALGAAATRFEREAGETLAQVNLKLRATFIEADGDELTIVSALLFALFLSVLVIACANLANLFLARTAARAHEIGMRTALGASRARLIRQLLTESILLASLGAAAGLALGAIGTSTAHDWLFTIATNAGAVMLPIALDWRVFTYTAGLGLAAGVAFGLLPAFDVTTIKRKRTRRLRNVLLTSQVAASFVLLLLGGVLVRNIQRLDTVQAGYDLARVFDLQLEPPDARVLARLRTMPGVAGVATVQKVPLYGPLRKAGDLAFNFIDEHYFATMGIPFLEGGQQARGAVVSQSTARRLWPRAAAVGQTLKLDTADVKGVWTVTGVVPDVINGWMFQGPEPLVAYLPGDKASLTNAIIRLDDAGRAALAAVRAACASVEGSIGCDPKSLREVSAMQRFPFEAAAAIAGMLGGLALVLTALGLYSVISYSVEQRRREIGILMALGAPASSVTGHVLSEAARCLLAGLALGLPVCLGLSALGASTVFQIRTFDAAAYVAVPLLLTTVAAAACLVPIRRALAVEPMKALRQE